MEAIGFALAALIGLSLGMLGGGGSILTVPIFVYVLGFSGKQAIAMSFPVVGATSLVGAVSHYRLGAVSLRTALLFGFVTMAGAFVGARYLATLLGDAAHLALLGLVMLAAALTLARRRDSDESAVVVALHARPALLVTAGLGLGLLTGLVGIGGGFLIVPALVVLAGVPIKQAVGTSLVVITMNTITGFLGYIGRVTIPWGYVTLFTLIAIAGILAGTRLVRYVSQAQLRRAFAVFLILMATLILWENRRVFGGVGDGSTSSISAIRP
jgi:uncharacterized protein